jgi:ESS family glutamate:Na+ symporter
MAMVSLDLVQITTLAGPVLKAVLVILAAQAVFTFIFAKFVVFRALGRDYEAGVLCGGFVGLQMGATPNAVAVMKAVTTKYRDAPNVFLTLPIVSGFLVDFVNASCITVFLNIFG